MLVVFSTTLVKVKKTLTYTKPYVTLFRTDILSADLYNSMINREGHHIFVCPTL